MNPKANTSKQTAIGGRISDTWTDGSLRLSYYVSPQVTGYRDIKGLSVLDLMKVAKRLGMKKLILRVGGKPDRVVPILV